MPLRTSLVLLEGMDHVLSSPPTSIPRATPLATHEAKESTTKDVGKDVVHPRATPTSFPQALFSITVIKFLLFGVGQHLIGKADFFELCYERTEINNKKYQGRICQNSRVQKSAHKIAAGNFD